MPYNIYLSLEPNFAWKSVLLNPKKEVQTQSMIQGIVLQIGKHTLNL